MKKYLGIIFLLFLAVYFPACQYNNVEELYPCDSTNSSYSLDVEPILKTNCYRCHDNSNSDTFANGFHLEGYANVTKLNTDLPGWIIGNIKHEPGFMAMPKGASKLSACDIAKIENWIRNGTPNN